MVVVGGLHFAASLVWFFSAILFAFFFASRLYIIQIRRNGGLFWRRGEARGDGKPSGFCRFVGRFGGADFGERRAGVAVEGGGGGKNKFVTQGVALSGKVQGLSADRERARDGGVAAVASGELGEEGSGCQHVVDNALSRSPSIYARCYRDSSGDFRLPLIYLKACLRVVAFEREARP